MNAISSAEQIMHSLAKYWDLHKTTDFLFYLKNTFGTAPLKLPLFDCIYIAQAKEGDPIKGWIGGLIEQWWIVDDNGTRTILNPDLPLLPNEPENLRSGFYPKPVMKFFFSAERITTGESFGPVYTCRKTARLQLGKDGLLEFVESHILWTSYSLGQK
jgi:hypothetical protein